VFRFTAGLLAVLFLVSFFNFKSIDQELSLYFVCVLYRHQVIPCVPFPIPFPNIFGHNGA
jgi:hypothetical protein